MPLRLPSITQQPVGEFALGNIQQPNYAAQGKAAQQLIGQAATAVALYQDVDSEIAAATGPATKELQGLRAMLTATNTIPTVEIPDYIVHEVGFTVLDAQGNEKQVGKPFAYTHEIAEEWWNAGSEQIIQHYADGIKNKAARAKFVGEMRQRYVAPGSLAIGVSNIVKGRAYNQALALRTIDDILTSDGTPQERATQVREILARQILLGQDPIWVAEKEAEIENRIEQFDLTRAIQEATSADAVQQLEEQMITGGTTLTPAQQRTIFNMADERKRDFRQQEIERWQGGKEELTSLLLNGQLNFDIVDDKLRAGGISAEAALQFRTALLSGSSTKDTNKMVLSQFRSKIAALRFVGGSGLTISQKADILRIQVIAGTTGVDAVGGPTERPAWITGTDAATLIREIDAAKTAAIENDEFSFAWDDIKYISQITDIAGNLMGNQSNINAALAFRNALVRYMNEYGIDAKPGDFVRLNKERYDVKLYDEPVAEEFAQLFPEARGAHGVLGTGSRADPWSFDGTQQRFFEAWLIRELNEGRLDPARANNMAAQFNVFFRGQGLAPNGQQLLLESDSLLYNQFEQQ